MSNATQLWVEAICWKCNAHMYGQWVQGGVIPITEFKLQAKELGWRRTTGGEFECPACNKKWLDKIRRSLA